jgi:hypothetical protein
MKVRLLQSLAGAGLSWGVGAIYECDGPEAERLIEAGIAERVKGEPVEIAVAPAVETSERKAGKGATK